VSCAGWSTDGSSRWSGSSATPSCRRTWSWPRSIIGVCPSSWCTPEAITATLKSVEAAGFDEVILYFNVGLKPHAKVKEEMQRFMEDVAPEFDG